MWPSDSTPRQIFKEIENICAPQNVCANVHSSFQSHVSTDDWMTECVYPYTGYSSAIKGNEALVTAAMWKKTLLSERSQMKND